MTLKIYAPFDGDIPKCRLNNTLHGRSVYRRTDVPGHNVDKGYNHPGSGDALDVFLTKGTPIHSPIAGTVVRMCRPSGKLDDCWIEGESEGHQVTIVLAHLHYKPWVYLGADLQRGLIIGFVADEVNDPHVHMEIWIDGEAVTARTPVALAKKFDALFARR